MSVIDIDGAAPTPHREAAEPGVTIHRHRWPTRIWHWVNLVALLVMLMSGLMIFNAHPRLYWGAYGANQDYPWLQIGASGGRGYVRVGSLSLDTTGVLGQSTSVSGTTVNRAFPYWMTIPSSYDLALSRLWHFAFAWIFTTGITGYLIWSLVTRHIDRDLLPTTEELRPRHIWQDIAAHARLRFPTGEAARHYNVLQKFAYVGVLLMLLPAMVLTGLTMSPGMNAAWPWLLDVFGGRQSARSIHFISAILIVLFVLVHVLMVVLAGPINEVRSMITGRYRLPQTRHDPERSR